MPRAWRADLTGQRFGRLVVESAATTVNARRRWVCRCDCGAVIETAIGNLRSGDTRSCGCLRNEMIGARRRTHGESRGSRTPEYRAWKSMKQRCYRKAHPFFADYGARGIAVCERWREDFAAFLADMGRRPSRRHSLDRIDVNGGYEPANCRWATGSEQCRNKRNNVLVTFGGRTATVAEWAEALGVKYGTLLLRVRRGWSAARIIGQPVRAEPSPASSRSDYFDTSTSRA